MGKVTISHLIHLTNYLEECVSDTSWWDKTSTCSIKMFVTLFLPFPFVSHRNAWCSYQKQFIFYSFLVLFCYAEWLIDVCLYYIKSRPICSVSAVSAAMFFRNSCDRENWINFPPLSLHSCLLFQSSSRLKLSLKISSPFTSSRSKVHKSIWESLRISTKLLSLMALRRYYVLFVLLCKASYDWMKDVEWYQWLQTSIFIHERKVFFCWFDVRDLRVMQADSESISLRVYLQMFHALIFMIYRGRTKKFHKHSKLYWSTSKYNSKCDSFRIIISK